MNSPINWGSRKFRRNSFRNANQKLCSSATSRLGLKSCLFPMTMRIKSLALFSALLRKSTQLTNFFLSVRFIHPSIHPSINQSHLCTCSVFLCSKDSTGIPHILEHSVLCGSRKYPLKEPFVELLKGSLHTFLNAFTYPDRTC